MEWSFQRADAFSFVVGVHTAVVVYVVACHSVMALVEPVETVPPCDVLTGPVDDVSLTASAHVVPVVERWEYACAFITVVFDLCPALVWASFQHAGTHS